MIFLIGSEKCFKNMMKVTPKSETVRIHQDTKISLSDKSFINLLE